MKLKLEDIVPTSTTMVLSGFPGRTFHLKPFSLLAHNFVNTRFGGPQALEEIFKQVRVMEICEIAHFLITGKKPSFRRLAEGVLTSKDQIALMQAVTRSIGVSQPIQDKLASELNPKKAQRKNSHPTGPKSST